jgi:hypothetical protein
MTKSTTVFIFGILSIVCWCDVIVITSFTAPLTYSARSRIKNKNNCFYHFLRPLYAKKKRVYLEGAKAEGFGSKTDSSSSLNDNKTRSVSGHRGSGEKPLRQAANTFDAIRKEYGKDCTNDVYCRSPLNDEETFWFVGKIAVRPNTVATPAQAILSQKRVILEYAKHELRPQNFGGRFSRVLELWLAPGDSEMDAVQNKIDLQKVEGSTAELHPDFSVKDVGFNPEIYVGDEVNNGGLRIKRDENGKSMKPVFDINQSL